jgi:hypothetical protein
LASTKSNLLTVSLKTNYMITEAQRQELIDTLYDSFMGMPDMGMGEMGECRDEAESIVNGWLAKNNIPVTKDEGLLSADIVNGLSEKYRAMIYVAVTTFFFYGKDIFVRKDGKTTVPEFREMNVAICVRVFAEVKSVFNYALSDEQLNRAVYSYLSARFNPQSVVDTEVFQR